MLVSVLWALVLIAGATALFVNVTGLHAQAGAAFDRNAVAETAADGVIRLVAYRLAFEPATDAGAARAPDGEIVACTLFGDVPARFAVQDQDGLLDLNYAPLPLLETVIRDSVQPELAARLIAAIGERRRAASNAGPSEPAAVAFRHPDDLLAVLDASGGQTRSVLSFLTVHSQSDGVDPAVAPAGLVAAVQAGKAELPAASVRLSRSKVYSITVEVGDEDRGRSVRRAVVELLRQPDQPYAVREWTSPGIPAGWTTAVRLGPSSGPAVQAAAC